MKDCIAKWSFLPLSALLYYMNSSLGVYPADSEALLEYQCNLIEDKMDKTGNLIKRKINEGKKTEMKSNYKDNMYYYMKNGDLPIRFEKVNNDK